MIEFIQKYPNVLLLAGMAAIGLFGLYVATLAVFAERRHEKRMAALRAGAGGAVSGPPPKPPRRLPFGRPQV